MANQPRPKAARGGIISHGSMRRPRASYRRRHSGQTTLPCCSNSGQAQDGFVKDLHHPPPEESNEKRTPGPCAGKPGVVITSDWRVKGLLFVSWRCYAVTEGRGVIATYSLLASEAPRHEALLRAMIDA